MLYRSLIQAPRPPVCQPHGPVGKQHHASMFGRLWMVPEASLGLPSFDRRDLLLPLHQRRQGYQWLASSHWASPTVVSEPCLNSSPRSLTFNILQKAETRRIQIDKLYNIYL